MIWVILFLLLSYISDSDDTTEKYLSVIRRIIRLCLETITNILSFIIFIYSYHYDINKITQALFEFKQNQLVIIFTKISKETELLTINI